MMEIIFSHIQKEWMILKKAPAAFLITLMLAVGAASSLLTWRYQGVIEHKSAVVESLNTELQLLRQHIEQANKNLAAYDSGAKTIPTKHGYYVEFTNLSAMAKQLAPTIPANEYVAVVPFSEGDKQTSLGRLLAEDLLVNLIQVQPGSFIDRSYLPQVVKELKLGSTGLTDPSKATRIGKIRPASILIVGQYIDMGTYLRVSVRVIEVESGLSLAAASQTLAKVEEADTSTVNSTNAN
ncbi:MAG: hypothetical protein D3908_08655 [Candidatus Electrothrix sp. AUS4]|nr:hypothetical protein [Candidatus Electrothrix sp. AUS4]